MYTTSLIVEGLARSSTHSKRRSNDSLVRQIVSRLPHGTSPYKAHTVSPSVATRVTSCPKRLMHHCLHDYVVFEKGVVCTRVTKLDSSASCFTRSRTLARLRLRPTRHVYYISHSGGLGTLVDAFQTTVKRQLGSPNCL